MFLSKALKAKAREAIDVMDERLDKAIPIQDTAFHVCSTDVYNDHYKDKKTMDVLGAFRGDDGVVYIIGSMRKA